MIKESLFLLALGFLTYLSIALYVGSATHVGAYGTELAQLLVLLFGPLVYLLPPLLYYTLYRLYKNPPWSRRRTEIVAASLLFIFAALTLQALFFDRGLLGVALSEELTPFIGVAGVSLFAFFLILNGWLLAFDVSMLDILRFFARLFPKNRLLGQWVAFREAAKDSFEDLIRREPPRTLEEIPVRHESPPKESEPAPSPRVDPEAMESYLRQKREELERVDESGAYEPDPSDKRRLKVMEAAGWPKEGCPFEPDAPETSEADEEVPKSDAPSTAAPESQKPDTAAKSDVAIVRELEENRRLLDAVERGKSEKPRDFQLPDLAFLKSPPPNTKNPVNETEIDAKIADLLEKLRLFKIEGDVVRTYTGPVVTTFEFKPAPHIKVSRILNLQDDIAMALKAQTIRIQAPIPGKDVVGIEIPNPEFETIYLRELLEAELFSEAASPLTIALGKDIVGNPFVTDLKKLPHLLIAGTTGSGKSVGINAMILSLLYRNSPDTLRLIMVDPKMLEFSIYNDIPHLLTPVITKPKQAIAALANTVAEMERRYLMMSQTKTKNIESYNQKAKEEGFEPLPFIVVVIDELADLMMTGGKDVEVSIARLAQMARASGIHLIIATQRPSVDVITGLIKANLPSRISYRVGSKVDSKVILDTQGAESLLGRGDLLFTPPGSVGLVRLHAPFSSESEIEKIADFLKAQRPPEYDNSFLSEGGDTASGSSEEGVFDEDLDEMYEEAKGIVLSERKSSISYIQRRLQIGYNRSARIVEQLEKTGVLSEANHKGQREILE